MDVGAGTAVSSSSGARGTYEDLPTSGKKVSKSKEEDDDIIKKPVDTGKEYAADDTKEYKTNFPYTGGFKNSAAEWLQILEQNAGDADIPKLPGEKTAAPIANISGGPAPTTPDAAQAGDPNAMPTDPNMSMGGDMGMGGMGGGMGMGMDPGPQQLTSNEIGRIYELKKIYSRLATIETFLQEETNERMVELRAMVSKAIDLFETVISNIQSYKDKLDDIIISFYKFLEKIFEEIRTYFKSQGRRSKE